MKLRLFILAHCAALALVACGDNTPQTSGKAAPAPATGTTAPASESQAQPAPESQAQPASAEEKKEEQK